ncbi:hypothetical protein ACHAXR_011479, partial [Thalassiosira sp. AJA248-18]
VVLEEDEEEEEEGGLDPDACDDLPLPLHPHAAAAAKGDADEYPTSTSTTTAKTNNDDNNDEQSPSPPSPLFHDTTTNTNNNNHHHAASAPNLLTNLPQTYRPFQKKSNTTNNNGGSAAAAAADDDDGSSPLASPTTATTTVGENSPTTRSGATTAVADYYAISTEPWEVDEAVPIGGYGSSHAATTNNPNNNTTNNNTPPSSSLRATRKLYNSLPKIPLSSLPIDALHATSNYCTPADWANLSCASRVWRDIGREVFTKVWRHAGLCMVEVGVAWARGEHADARELASLYITKGVPIYPTPHGHSYHTIAWRMGLELEHHPSLLQQEEEEEEQNQGGRNDNDAEGNNTTTTTYSTLVGGNITTIGGGGGAASTRANTNFGGGNNNNQGGGGGGARTLGNNANNNNADNATTDDDASGNTDAFYTERYDGDQDNNHRDSLFSRNHLTYVEEKALFWKQKRGIEVKNPPSPTNNNNNTSIFPPAPQARGGALFPRFTFPGGPNENAPPRDGGVGLGGGIGLARPPPLPSASAALGTATAPIMGAGGGGGVASLVRPQSAVPGAPRFGAWAEAAENSSASAAASSASSSSFATGHQRYERRSSFSGTVAGGPLSSFGNVSSPNLLHGNTNSTNSNNMGGNANGNWDLSRSSNPCSSPARASMAATPSAPKMTLRIHRHLADQHFFGSPSVNDENGSMNEGKMSMNADFFHPTWEGGRKGLLGNTTNNNNNNNRVENWDGYWDGTGWRTTGRGSGMGHHGDDDADTATIAPAPLNGIGATIDRGAGDDEEPAANDSDGNYRAAVRAFVNMTLANADRDAETARVLRRSRLPVLSSNNNAPMSIASSRAAARLHSLLSNPSTWVGGGDNDGSWNSRASFSGSPSFSAAAAPPSSSSSPASDVHLEVYSSSSANLKSEEDDSTNTNAEALAKMRTRCKHYQTKLDVLLKNSNYDTLSFQETLLDFWDELFPTTAGIHFYNQQSPVPRMSHLHQFLTTPCPKAIGTVQCEIERVKVSSRKNKEGGGKGGMKGLGKGSMKGRFFPSYEYRLFIRDTKNDNPFHSSRYPPRKDSVLLVAKNKSGKNRNIASSNSGGGGGGTGVGGIEFAGGMTSPTSTTSSKRGVTNYYMCLPNQRDVDSHYKSANRNNANATLQPGQSSGLAVSPIAAAAPPSAPVEVGRLQSNFIGTEFQIFVPIKAPQQQDAQRNAAQVYDPLLDTSSEGGSDSRVHPIESAVPAVDTATASTSRRQSGRRGSGLVRLARRASGRISRRGSRGSGLRSDSAAAAEIVGGADPTEDDGEQPRRQRRGSLKKAGRRMSWGSPSANTNKKMSRRAIANKDSYYEGGGLQSPSSSLLQNNNPPPVTMGEIEDGAITYTANLLGNRPRIMDVCIPKLMEDGRVCDEWKGGKDAGGGFAMGGTNGGGSGSTTTMLDRFKTIQQGLESLEDNFGLNHRDDNGDNADTTSTTTDNHGLMILQNRPPWWNIELGAFVLNFGGRVKVASVKNFQLCERNDQDHIMQFGRIEGRHAFTMDFQHPLTPMQAFAIAISSLQSKISFG